ncbi:MAG: UDP-2,4-diacetamido-2,4,6-trideoxy-beta-L-altropyranose hydrolase [Phycisphaerae bacterium]|nr:UDP-2,4-diacetamido-2,4,6-trideoxy-beta-L-altropyranose hydrolase [Phycisphaerae bacterium]
MVGSLLIRADAGSEIGTGHVMRCLALAQAWRDRGGRATFAMAARSPVLEARLRSEGMGITHLAADPGSVEDAIKTAGLARQVGATWAVVDGYRFGAEYQRAVKDLGLRILLIDDNRHAKHYWADALLNQNIHACDILYTSREPYTRLLLGTRYALLRREFLRWVEWRRVFSGKACKVLVTMGGSDPHNVTLKVLQALRQIDVPGLTAKLVVGPANPHLETLRAALPASQDRLLLLTDVTDMPGLMVWADVAVSGGGGACGELAFMKLPFVVMVLADNQQAIAAGMAKTGAALDLGWHNQVTVEQLADTMAELLDDLNMRKRMGRRGGDLVDGLGARRVSEFLCEPSCVT